MSYARVCKKVTVFARRAKNLVLVFVAPLICVFVLTRTLENGLDGCTTKWLETCGQFFTGNWPNSDGIIDHKSWGFASGVTFRFAVTYGTLAGLIKIWKDLVSWKAEELTVKYSEIMKDRDTSIENEIFEILTEFPQQQQQEIADRVRAAFQRGEQRWRDVYLPIILGSQVKAQAFLDKYDADIGV